MKQGIRVLIFIFALTVIALPHCATNRAAEPARLEMEAPRLEAPKAEPAIAGADEKVIAPSETIGSVYRLNAGTREVLVRTKRILKMGERVYAEVGDAKAMMEATFPMLTSSKCTLEAASRKYFGRLSKGMPVYAYVRGGGETMVPEVKLSNEEYMFQIMDIYGTKDIYNTVIKVVDLFDYDTEKGLSQALSFQNRMKRLHFNTINNAVSKMKNIINNMTESDEKLFSNYLLLEVKLTLTSFNYISSPEARRQYGIYDKEKNRTFDTLGSIKFHYFNNILENRPICRKTIEEFNSH